MNGTKRPTGFLLGRGWLALAAALLVAAAGCEKLPEPYVPKSATPPPIQYCNDYTGHLPGSKPFAMGGACCCTPSEELMQKLHKDGFCSGMTADQLAKLYEDQGIRLRGPGHMHCDGLCPAGPHVVLGGKCLCPPTPGTDYYERVVRGTGAPPPPHAR
jgi:hypothetical protein